MNTNRLIAAIALTFAASGAAMAQEATYDYPQAAVSQVSRSAVLADLNLARAEGKLLINEASLGSPVVFIAQRSRDAVRTEAQLAVRSGSAKALSAEPHAFSVDVNPVSAPQVLASK